MSRIKKSAAKLLVSRFEAEKITRELYRRRTLSPEQEYERRLAVIRTHYIPKKMPAKELPGLRFKQAATALAMQANSQVIGIRRLRRDWVTA